MKAPCKKHISVGHRQLRFELQQSPQGCPTLTGFNHRRAEIKTTRLAGGLLFGYNPRKAGARLKTPAFTLFRPYCP